MASMQPRRLALTEKVKVKIKRVKRCIVCHRLSFFACKSTPNFLPDKFFDTKIAETKFFDLDSLLFLETGIAQEAGEFDPPDS